MCSMEVHEDMYTAVESVEICLVSPPMDGTGKRLWEKVKYQLVEYHSLPNLICNLFIYIWDFGSRYLPSGRQFEVFINSLTAEPYADAICWTKHGKVLIYKDYVVIVSKKGKENKQNITIHLHPLLAVYYDALNGIEVFKMNILMAIWLEPTMNHWLILS
ncbi:hypothetical protein GOBAR_DD09418 [Gossypium barbadense]|nr:hypothetical protein GOBAR_DD09418 [Gossypium barbadense]